MATPLKTAQDEAAEARDTLAALQDRVRNGDENVTAAQIADQRELIAFAELRVEAAQLKETRIREYERDQLGAAAKNAAEELLNGARMDDIAQATKDAVAALQALSAAVGAWNGQITEVGTTLAQLDADLRAANDTEDQWGSKQYGVWGDRKRIILPGQGAVDAINLSNLSVAVVVAGLGNGPAGREAQAQHMKAFNGLRNMVVKRVIDTMPALADALQATPEEWAALDTNGRRCLIEQGRRPEQGA